MDFNDYKHQNLRLKEFESKANINKQQNETDLAYRVLNSKFTQAEDATFENAEVLKTNKEKRKEKKKSIEKAWHENTKTTAKTLTKSKGVKKKKNTDKEFYSNFNLKELEILMKNSDNGGNSDEYNDVATDLELYNRVVTEENSLEGLGLLRKLKASCENYLRLKKKSPFSTTGKIRRAIVEKLTEKVKLTVDEETVKIKAEAEKTFTELNEAATEESITAAFKAQFNLMFHYLNGNVELKRNEINMLDTNFHQVMEKVKDLPCDDNQSPVLSTKFFNALGWTDRKPKEMEHSIDETEKQSPVNKRMYHTICPYGDNKTAEPSAYQLTGTAENKSRQYLSDGAFGRGTYTAAKSDNEGATDELASANSWEYGTEPGSVQLTMCLNGNARIVEHSELVQLIEQKIKDTFPNLYGMLGKNGPTNYRFGTEYISMFAAMFGFNTIRNKNSVGTKIDYYVTFDRSALTIWETAFMRNEDNSTDGFANAFR